MGNVAAISNYLLLVYNRYGELVFYTRDAFKRQGMSVPKDDNGGKKKKGEGILKKTFNAARRLSLWLRQGSLDRGLVTAAKNGRDIRAAFLIASGADVRTQNNAPLGSAYVVLTPGNLAPGASVSATLQSIMPAPVLSRRSFTNAAVIVAMGCSSFEVCKKVLPAIALPGHMAGMMVCE